MKYKNAINLFMGVLLVSCVSEKSALKTSIANTSSAPSSDAYVAQSVLDSGIAVKTFNQYNITLSKATGIDSAKAAITTEYDLIKNSLPSNNSTGSFTSFHQIAQTRLAFAYCNDFVNTNAEFVAFNYTTSTPQYLSTQLLTRFIGPRPTADFVLYDKYNEVLLKIFENKALDDAGNNLGLLIPRAIDTTFTVAVLNRNLMKLGCAALLSSSEFTLL